MTLNSISWNMIAGGFGMFLFGIKFMGDGLKAIAGDKLRDYIDKYTSNPLLAVFIGAIITIAIQSSSASTAITIGLVRAGLMTLEQSAAIVMGANIGTTVTSFLIGLNIDAYALYFVAIGSLVICFSKRKKQRYIGEIIFGFGVIFYGLSIMGDALKALKDLPEFDEIARSMTVNPFLGLIAGTIITGIIQGSAAAIGVVQKIYEAGGIDFIAVIPFVYGANIGTTVTGVLAALGGSFSAKRTAGIHILFNVIGTVIGMLILQPLSNSIMWLSNNYDISPMLQIALVHIFFNVVATIICFPMLKTMCNFIRKVFPGEESVKMEVKIDDLNTDLANTLPGAALNISDNAISQMAAAVENTVKETHSYLSNKGTSEDKDIISQSETLINNFDKKITNYLMDIANEVVTETDTVSLNLQLQIVKNLERIGDLSMNVTEFIDMVYDDRGDFSGEAKVAIDKMFNLIYQMLNKAMAVYSTKDVEIYKSLQEDETKMDRLEFKARESHFKRMANKECVHSVASSVYCDILSNLERMADHCVNIARSTLKGEHRINIKKAEII